MRPSFGTNLPQTVTHIWQKAFFKHALAVKDYRSEWVKAKENYPIGCKVQIVCQYFYPQGAIAAGDDFVAVYRGTEESPLRKSLTAQVAGYDEVNMWLVLQ